MGEMPGRSLVGVRFQYVNAFKSYARRLLGVIYLLGFSILRSLEADFAEEQFLIGTVGRKMIETLNLYTRQLTTFMNTCVLKTHYHQQLMLDFQTVQRCRGNYRPAINREGR